MKQGKKKTKKVTGKKKIVVKKVQKRKVVRKKKPAKRAGKIKGSESVFGSKMTDSITDAGVKILVTEEVSEIADEPIAQPVFEAVDVLPTTDYSEVVDVTGLTNAEVESEIENLEDNSFEVPIASEAEIISSEYQPEELEAIENQGYLNDRHKSIIMYVAIACIMVIIVVFWGLSIKYSLSQNLQDARLNGATESEDVRELKESLNGMKNDFSQISDYAKEQLNQALNLPDQSKNQIIENQIKNEVAQELQQKLNNLNTSASGGNTN